MSITAHQIAGCFLFCLTGVLLSGCAEESEKSETSSTAASATENSQSYPRDKDAHQHPESLADAVTQLEQLRDTIRDGFAAGDMEVAHGPLHDVGHLLNEVKVLSANEVSDPEQLKSVNESIEVLFTSFGAVDAVLHKKEGQDYSEVSEAIDNAINSIKMAATAADLPETEAESGDPLPAEDDNSASEPNDN